MKQIITTALLITISGSLIQAQKSDSATIRKIVESQNYVFTALSALPQQGATKHLTSEYDLVVTKDTVISYLPYFGRAYTAPIGASEGGIKFTSVNFTYSLEKKKKSSWEILIKPKDASEIQQLYLTIFDDGNASLRVTSVNRQGISFNGYITAGKPRDKKAF